MTTWRGHVRYAVSLLALLAIVLVLLAVIGLALWAIALSWKAILLALGSLAILATFAVAYGKGQS